MILWLSDKTTACEKRYAEIEDKDCQEIVGSETTGWEDLLYVLLKFVVSNWSMRKLDIVRFKDFT